MVSVTELLQAEGFIDTTWYDDYGRDRGSYAHKAIHLYDTEELDEEILDPVLVPYLAAWKKFLRESKFKVADSEVRIDNGQFTGKPDKVGFLNGQPTILDNKTGTIEPWVALQLAGYEILKGSPHKRIAVKLKDNGTYSLKEFKDRQDRQIFLAALACYQWKANNLKGR
jgi:hypothetical protein